MERVGVIIPEGCSIVFGHATENMILMPVIMIADMMTLVQAEPVQDPVCARQFVKALPVWLHVRVI
jgi:hypothetical protein